MLRELMFPPAAPRLCHRHYGLKHLAKLKFILQKVLNTNMKDKLYVPIFDCNPASHGEMSQTVFFQW